MSKGPARVHKSDVRRAIEAIELAGKKVNRIEIAKDGKLMLVVDDGVANPTNVLDAWRAGNARPA